MLAFGDNHGPKVCVLAYDGLCTFEFGLAVEVFGLPRPEFGRDWYRFAVAGIDQGPFRAMGGLTVAPDHGIRLLGQADVIIIPGWRGSAAPVPESLRRHLRRAHDRGARMASICSGAFVLAAAGLLDGRRATTHWRYAEQLAAAAPAAEVLPDVLYVDEGRILTSAGSAAGLDLCLHLVRQDFGAEKANQVARRLVLPAHRQGGQRQFVPQPVAVRRVGELAPFLDQLRSRVDEDWTVGKMATAAGMSSRTLLRRFRQTTGESPLNWLTAARVDFARDLLETTDLKIDRIAERAGFGASESFRLHFRRRVGVAPSTYRRGFKLSA